MVERRVRHTSSAVGRPAGTGAPHMEHPARGGEGGGERESPREAVRSVWLGITSRETEQRAAQQKNKDVTEGREKEA